MTTFVRRCALMLTALLPFCLQAQNNKQIIDQVVATVGGEIILLSDVQEQVSYARQQQQQQLPPNFECFALQNIIVQKLLIHQAKLDSVEVKDEEVETQLNARIDRLMLYFNQDPQAVEAYYGQSVTAMKEQLRGDMRDQLLAERMQGQITSKATVTPVEVQTFYKAIPIDSLPYFNSEVEIREIVYRPQVNPVERDRSRKRAEELRQRLMAGEDFATLAKRYSDDPGSGANGGDLGWQKRGTFVPDFEAAAYKLEKGQISQVVETEFGFHIIQLLERRGNLLHARHILVKPEITDNDLDAAAAKLDTVRRLILSNNISFSDAVKKYGDKNIQSYHNDGRVANPRSGNTFFEVADLDTDIFFAVDTLQPGSITQPIAFKMPDGTRLYRLVQLTSRSKPHRADLAHDYNKIQQAALEQKKADYTDRWVVEKLQSTHLAVRPTYAGCPNLQFMLGGRQKTRKEP